MKKNRIWMIVLVVVLLICIIIYFRPLPLSKIANDNSKIIVTVNEYVMKNGSPGFEVVGYEDISEEQKQAILDVLDKYTYRRTLSTPFSNGTMTGIGNKLIYIDVVNDSAEYYFLAISSKEIVIDGKNYRMKNAEQFIAQIISIME